MKFNIGDKVSFLNERRAGVIKQILHNNVFSVEIEDGFEIPVASSELVKNIFEENINHHNLVFEPEFDFSNSSLPAINKLISEKEFSEKKNQSRKHNRADDYVQEIDLHIENLIGQHKYLSNGEIIVIQLNFFQSKLEAAIRNKLSKLVVIHGVGNGVLKSEIRKILHSYSGVDFFDASYSKYGFGATEIRLK